MTSLILLPCRKIILMCPRSSEYLSKTMVSCLHTQGGLCSSAQPRPRLSVKDCFSLLEVDPDCTEEQLRHAYLQKVKIHHPDRNSATSDSNKFTMIQEAYKTALGHKRGQALLHEEEEKRSTEPDIKHTVPQHRRYLTFDGVGFGSPSHREKQFKRFRVAQAAESVFEHRIMQHGSTETAVVTKDKAEARKIKISNLIDRVVDDLIRESMQRGDFDNLSGRGRPLDHSDYNPFIDPTTHNINKIMVSNGFKPEWILLAKEIRDGIMLAREKLAIIREQLGPPPYSDIDEVRWNNHVGKFREDLDNINLKIDKYNFIVPFMDKQMVRYTVDSNIQKVLDDHVRYLPRDAEGKPMDASQLAPLPVVKTEDMRIRWGEVWFNIKQVFAATRQEVPEKSC